VKVINLIVKDLDAVVYRSMKRLDATYKEILCALNCVERKVHHCIDAEQEWELLEEEFEIDEDQDNWEEAE